jgi:hypothetical protein
MVILYLFKDSVKTNDQVEAIHEQPNSYKADQCHLIIAECLPHTPFIISKRARRLRKIAVP